MVVNRFESTFRDNDNCPFDTNSRAASVLAAFDVVLLSVPRLGWGRRSRVWDEAKLTSEQFAPSMPL